MKIKVFKSIVGFSLRFTVGGTTVDTDDLSATIKTGKYEKHPDQPGSKCIEQPVYGVPREVISELYNAADDAFAFNGDRIDEAAEFLVGFYGADTAKRLFHSIGAQVYPEKYEDE